MAMVKLSAPWVVYYKELQELFMENTGIKMIFDEDAMEIKIYVSDVDTAAALSELLPVEKEFGNITLIISVIPANGKENAFKSKATEASESYSKKELIRNAFKNNDIVSYMWDVSEDIPGLNIFYVVFENAVVQYYTDTMADPHGLCSTLYENIAREVFGEIPGVFFCTSTPPVF